MAMALKGLAKLAEELGELQAVVGKKMAYFDTDVHPDGAGSLAERMQDEMGDVMAAMRFVANEFDLDDKAVLNRASVKLELYEQWRDDPNEIV
jgi:NTP pyrophosphatase (non-canonical NTP hydrolase)